MNPKIQERLNAEKHKIQQIKDKSVQALRLYPYELKSIDEIKAKITQQQMSFFDISFPPEDSSAFCAEEEEKYPFKYEIHWRRAEEFLVANAAKGLRPAQVFYEDIEPGDIKQGTLGNCWFMCALASLAERPKLVENLFITKEKNKEGIYRIKFCKNGEWVEVTIDDYFPCLPFNAPLFSRAHDNEMWVLLIEKAYAKLHGNYFTLRGGFANEGMIDLTGCPSSTYDFQNKKVTTMIDSGELFQEMLRFDELGYLLSASTPGEDRWTETGGPNKDGGLVPGHAYSVIQVKEAYGNRLVNIRNPWGQFEWDGDWCDSSDKWTQAMIDAINPVLDDADGTFWMSFEDFVQFFRSLNVCRVRNWQENRIRGKFLRLNDPQDPNFHQVSSKWYYEFEVKEETHMFIGLHQEDERIQGVLQRRPFIDCSLAILRINSAQNVELVDYKHFVKERQVELEARLEPGKYLVLPRTTGGLMGLKSSTLQNKPPSPMVDRNGHLTRIFEGVIEDIFRKFDLFIGRELSYDEFKIFYQCTGFRPITEQDFKNNFLTKYCSTEEGITVRGLKHFFQESIQQHGDKAVRKWLERLGYDEHFFNPDSRVFTMTFHSTKPFSVVAKDAIQTELDDLTSSLIAVRDLEVNGPKKDFIHRFGTYQILYSYSDDAYSYSYSAINLSSDPIEVTADFTQSEGMIGLPDTLRITKVVQPGEPQFLMHVIAHPEADSFVKRCHVTHRNI